MRKTPRRRWAALTLGLAVLAAAAAGGGLGYFLRLDLPDVRALEDYDPPLMTQLLAADGTVVGTFGEQRRTLISYHEIPLAFRQALVATEDSSFYEHMGIDPKGVARAVLRDVTELRLAEGASTLTQQLARNLFLRPDKTVRRKVQEAFLALDIERQYTKDEILGFYCNQIYMGHGRYGLEAAARFFFAKPARELTLTESATLAGILQRPEALSPLKHPDRALRRRNFVLSRMAEERFLTPEEAVAAAQAPLGVRAAGGPERDAPYFVEGVRRWLVERYGTAEIYRAGFEVQSTLDPVLQRFADEAVELGLRQLDKRQGWRGDLRRVPEGASVDTWEAPAWAQSPASGRVTDGVIVSVDGRHARVRVAALEGRLGAEEIAWTGRLDPRRLFRVGDVVRVRVRALGADGTAELALEQEPIAEAALVAIEPSTGALRALVGGFDFARSEFDRVTQARRQTGSAFKPFVYATALAQGWTLADTLVDAPTVFLDPTHPEPYQPENYGGDYYATLTLRSALEHSANIATIKLLDRVGPAAVIETARRLGIRGALQPYPSLALGAFETTLLELTSAYGALANQGVLVEPHCVEGVRRADRSKVERIAAPVSDAVSPQIAFLMNRVLAGVIADGTGRAASALGAPLAGKTGTTDENTDAWFVGYSPRLAVGVWVGFDEPRSLGSRETGAGAALPIWTAFMERALAVLPHDDFVRPPGIVLESVDRATGLRASPAAGCREVSSEVFLAGTEPTKYCTAAYHALLALPYPFQRYSLDDDGSLLIPQDQLEALLVAETGVRRIEGGTQIEYDSGGSRLRIGVRTVPADPARERLDEAARQYEVTPWVGRDGRRAEIVWLRGAGPNGARARPRTRRGSRPETSTSRSTGARRARVRRH